MSWAQLPTNVKDMGLFDNLFGKKPEPSNEPTNFVLTDIERKTINGRNYVFQYVNFKEHKMPLVGLVSDHNPNFVEFSSKRPKDMQPEFGQVGCVLEVSEFFSDLVTITKFLNSESNLTDHSYIKAIEQMCRQHIEKSARLIDNDLYTYIDLVIIAMNGISNKLKNYQISDEEATTFWIQIFNHSKQCFADNIFLTKYDMSNTLEPKPYLVKLKQ